MGVDLQNSFRDLVMRLCIGVDCVILLTICQSDGVAGPSERCNRKVEVISEKDSS